ncbi:hypothetical protein DTO027I6_8538 [Penicillium roqueforti]|uniref:uncharacterized protein n=1 Tax=Penicillium roqueforti TaxID=5082 RepID=UPI00190BF010|nr:uncharacterized protein LCP9604111_5157 [Penicillium roqueforti]KAF9248407.1 hypothetical protein LCP9604111_5157 [Penicillium roqueforti]KAI3153452.1 hypothetical protein CBS147317_6260 [Penicillium roqueforti]KAI3190019.1 hypothetical protein DTO027I6_8538 [Penicillium roqueforti]
MYTPVINDGDFCMGRSPCTCPRHRCHSGHSIKHSSHARPNDQLHGLFWHLGQVTPLTDKTRDFDHTSLEPLGSLDIHFGKDSGPFPVLLPSNDDDRLSTIPRFTEPSDPLNPPAGFAANNSLFGEPPFEAADVHLNIDHSSTANLHSLLVSPPLESCAESGPITNSDFCMDYALGSDDSDEPMLDYSTLPNLLSAYNYSHSSSLSTPPFGSEGSLGFNLTIPPPTTMTYACLAECRPPCIITATLNLRLLHIRENSCFLSEIVAAAEARVPVVLNQHVCRGLSLKTTKMLECQSAACYNADALFVLRIRFC